MKITLIILQTVDGYLACDSNDDLSWGSKEDKEFFRNKTKEIGTMIMGSCTFEKMPDIAFKDRMCIVMTTNAEKYEARIESLNKAGVQIELSASTPQMCITYLETKGIEHVALIGGGKLNGAFLKAGLIDEIFVTIAPVIFGNGVKSFNLGTPEPIHADFRLVDVDKIENREVLLHYVKA